MNHFALMTAMAAMVVGSATAQPTNIDAARRIGDPTGTGRWPAVAEGVADAPGYTVYRPAKWPREQLPLILWGNGGCRNNGLSASHFLREIASHGYIVIANGAPREEKSPLAALPKEGAERASAGPPPSKADETQVTQMLGAIDWAKRSIYSDHVDAKRIAVMGHSCGGLQALAAGADPRIGTVVAFNSGVYNRSSGGLSGVRITKDDLKKLHTPVAYILGGPSDIAYPNGSDDVARISHVPVFYANKGTGHGGTFSLVNGGDYGRVAVGWLNWQLKQDAGAARMFVGARCVLCQDPSWSIIRKQFPEQP